jgi:small subunit ribosomal protein S10
MTSVSKIYVVMHSYFGRVLDSTSSNLAASLNNDLDIIKSQEVESKKEMSLFSLPKKKKSYCVLRSPHVNKDSREQFETIVYKQVIAIRNTNNKLFDPIPVIDLIDKFEMPAGISSYIQLNSLA